MAAGDDEVGERVLAAATDATPQLVELGQAEAVGPVDDDRVGPRDVQTVLDDRGGYQHLKGPVNKPVHDVLELTGRHLAMGDLDESL